MELHQGADICEGRHEDTETFTELASASSSSSDAQPQPNEALVVNFVDQQSHFGPVPSSVLW